MSNNQQQNNENQEEDDEDGIHQTLGFRQTVCKAKKAFLVAAVALSAQSPSSSPQREVITSFRDKLSCQNLKKELLLQQQQSQKQLESMNEQRENSKQQTKTDKQDNEHHIFINENPPNHRKTTALQDNMHNNNRTFVGFFAAMNHYQDIRHTTSSPSQSPSSQDNKNNIHRFRQTLAMFKQQKYHEQQLKLQQQFQQWQEADNVVVAGNVSGPLYHQEQQSKANQNSSNIDPLSLTQNIQKHEQFQQRNRGQAVGYLCKQNVVNRLVLKQTEKHRLAGRQRFSLEVSNYTSSQSQLLEIQANSLLKPSQVISQRYSTPNNNQMENTSNIQSRMDRKILSQLNHSFYSGQAQKQQHSLPQYQDKNARKRSLSSSFSYHNSRRASGNCNGNQNNNIQLVKSQHQEVGDEEELQCKNNSYIPLKLFKRNDQRIEDNPRNASDLDNNDDVGQQESHQDRIIVEGNCTDINTTCKEIVSSSMTESNRKLKCKDKENTSNNNKSNNRKKTSQLTLDQHWERLFETPQKYSPTSNHLKSHQNLSEIPGLTGTTLGSAETAMFPANPRRITTAIECSVETEGEGEKNSGRSGSTFGCKMPPKHIYNKNIQSKRCSTSAVSTEDRTMKIQYSGNDNKRRRKSSYQRTSNNGNQLFVDALGGFNQVQSPYQAYLSQITPTIAYLQSPQSQRHQFNSHVSDPHNSIENKLLIQNPFRKNSPSKSRILFTCKGEKYGRAASNSEQHKENAPIQSIMHGEMQISKTLKSHSNNHILIVNNPGNNAEVLLPEVEGEQIKKSSKIPQKGEDKNNNGTEIHDSQKINNHPGDDQKQQSTSPFRRSNFVELQFRDWQKEKSKIAVPSRSKQQSACEKRVRRMHDLIAESELQSQLQKQNKPSHNSLASQNNSPSVLKWYINGTDSTSNSNTSSVYLDRYDDSQKRGIFQQSQDITASNSYKRGSSQSESRRLVKLVKYYNNKYGEKLINNGDKASQLLESPIFKASNTPLSRQTRKHASEICPWNSQQLLENDDGI